MTCYTSEKIQHVSNIHEDLNKIVDMIQFLCKHRVVKMNEEFMDCMKICNNHYNVLIKEIDRNSVTLMSTVR